MFFENQAETMATFCRLYLKQRFDLPIRPSEMGALIFIVKADQKCTSVQISQYFQITKPSVSEIVKVLMEQGYVKKVQSETDKRAYLLEATEKGIGLVNDTEQLYYLTFERLNQNLGEAKMKNLLALLQEANAILVEG